MWTNLFRMITSGKVTVLVGPIESDRGPFPLSQSAIRRLLFSFSETVISAPVVRPALLPLSSLARTDGRTEGPIPVRRAREARKQWQ